ncbi:MAG: ERF family protein [Prevotellaceae bacterium]|nr:ERF family protein [Prevotellaceae bacterium]
MEIQSRLKAPKTQRNSFGGFRYRSCEDIMEALKPLLREAGCALVVTDSVEVIQSGIYIKATATLYDTETGESLSGTAYAEKAGQRAGMDPSQLTGSASSYARKYALNGLFCIDDSSDPDTDESTCRRLIAEAQTEGELNKIYKERKEMQGDRVFLAMLTKRKEEIRKNNSQEKETKQ